MVFCEVCKNNNLSPPPLSPLNEEEIKPNYEGLYFTIALSNVTQIWYVES